MPFNVSEEQSLLASMVAERDAQISSLTHQLHSASEALHTTQTELRQKSASRRAQREDHSAAIKRLKEEHAEQRRILARFEQNVKGGGGLRVHEYAALMRSANSSQVESSYVIRLQAQLCRAMHSLGVMESQLALVKENCSSLIRFMKEDLSHMVDDRTRREIELMNGLARADGEKRVMAGEMEQKIQEKEELLDQVREEYEELGMEYDENEVKRALEIKYLLEQMEKVREDKVRLEKELLAALLEREEKINILKVEAEKLGVKLDGLKKEAGRRDIHRNREEDIALGGSDNNEEMSQEDKMSDDADCGEDEQVQVDEEEKAQLIGEQEEVISEITSKFDNTTVETPVLGPDGEVRPNDAVGSENSMSFDESVMQEEVNEAEIQAKAQTADCTSMNQATVAQREPMEQHLEEGVGNQGGGDANGGGKSTLASSTSDDEKAPDNIPRAGETTVEYAEGTSEGNAPDSNSHTQTSESNCSDNVPQTELGNE